MATTEVENKVDRNPLLYVTSRAYSSDIFKFLEPLKNDKLSDLSPLDLQQFLVLLDQYYLEYRRILGIRKDIRFAFKNKLDKILGDHLENYLNELTDGDSGWCVNYYGTKESKQSVFQSADMHDEVEDWLLIKTVLKNLSKVSKSGKYCFSRVFIGGEVIGDDFEAWQIFIKLWYVYENIIYRFTNGEYLNRRPNIINDAQPGTSRLMNPEKVRYITNVGTCTQFLENVDCIFTARGIGNAPFNMYELNAANTHKEEGRHDVIEFRCPNGTLDPVILQNNINLFVKMFLASKSGNIDVEVVENRFKKNTTDLELKEGKGVYGDYENFYDLIYIEQALEFADLIFDNNLDKVYFLRQYFKSLEVPKKNNHFQRAKRFTEEHL